MFPTFELQIQPHVQKLVGAQPGHAVHLEGVRTEVPPPNVEVARERCDAAEALRALGQDRTTGGVRESDRAQGFSVSSGSQDRIVNQGMRAAAVRFLTASNPLLRRQSEENLQLVLNKIIDSGTL